MKKNIFVMQSAKLDCLFLFPLDLSHILLYWLLLQVFSFFYPQKWSFPDGYIQNQGEKGYQSC